MINTLVFEDAHVAQLAPISTSRPAFAITCASYRLIDLLAAIPGPTVVGVRPFLQSTVARDFAGLSTALDPQLEMTLVVNARLVPSIANLTILESLVKNPGQPSATACWTLEANRTLAAALVPTASIADGDIANFSADSLTTVVPSQPAESDNELTLLAYPHDVIVENMNIFVENLAHRIRGGHYREQNHGVYLGQNVVVDETAVFDTSTGPIVIDDDVKIGPFSFFRGPLYVGPQSKISEHASIKDAVSIGGTCKIGGEVEGTIVESFSNKQHHGFLGHAYLGSWINLGAGTCNSDLKNTYGAVNMIYGDTKVSTGSQFIGCVMGDYCKTAINTSIFTGKTIGVGSMVYGFATTNVPAFVNYAHSFGQMGEIPATVIATTQRRMFQRRGLQQEPCDIQLIEAMFAMTADQRPAGLSQEPLEL